MCSVISSQAAELCDHELDNCAAISLSTDGQLRVYNQTHLSSLIYNQAEWVTLMHTRKYAQNQVPDVLQDVNFCCPMTVRFAFVCQWTYSISCIVFQG